MSTVGDNILFMRKQLGLTQEELAKRMGYKSKSTINKIELGVNDIPQSKIVQFAEVLETTPARLMGWSESEEKNSPNELQLTEGEKMLLELFRKIPADRQDEALDLLRVALRMQKKL
jgi:transcriptional regulator with XRE-family HTH domain